MSRPYVRLPPLYNEGKKVHTQDLCVVEGVCVCLDVVYGVHCVRVRVRVRGVVVCDVRVCCV